MYHRNTDPSFKTIPSYQVRPANQTARVDEAEQRRHSIPATAYGDEIPALQVIDPPLGPQPQSTKFFRSHVVTLALRDRVLSFADRDFTLRTADDQDILKCKAQLVSMHGKKKFTDMEGNEIYTLSNKVLAVHKSFCAESPTHEHDFEVRSGFQLEGNKSEVVFRNAADGKGIVLDIVGKWRDKSAEIRFGDHVAASISRNFFDARDSFGVGDKHTYFVAVAPNVDLSLIAGVCVCLDEREREANG